MAPASEAALDIFDDDDEGWQDMPVVRESDEFAGGLDEEDQKKYKYVAAAKKTDAGTSNATGDVEDVDFQGSEWRKKVDQNESEYTRLRATEEDENDEVHLRTKYLFDEDKAMTPLSQMQATKDLLTEAQRIAYVGLCSLTTREMAQRLKDANSKQLKDAIQGLELWSLKIMGRLYYHMEIATEEQKMIESLAQHGVQPMDLVPALMTTHTVANPEYDPAEAKRQAEEERLRALHESEDIAAPPPYTPTSPYPKTPETSTVKQFQTTTRVLEETSTTVIPGVSTSLSAADANVTLDIRWTVLCDLFLLLIADSVYDARSRVLLETIALKLGLGWLDLAKFERRVTEALEIQEGVEKLEQQEVIEGRQKSSKKRRYMMMGLATLGGGLVIGLSAGLLAPVIGAGLGAALTTVGISGTTAFLGGAGGAAVITTGGVLTGSGIAARGMARRTRLVRTFDILPLHNNKRVNCILTVPGFLTGLQDDPRLPYSVLDPVVGDVFSVLWEPEMIRETGDALKILTSEVLSQLAQTALQATVMTALMSALQWPIILTKLGYLIDNPWSNALDRAKAAGGVLADVLIQRHLGVRPVTLIGFSLGSRVIFYALLELARQKAYGIVQDVFIMGTTVTASTSTWHAARSAVAGRFVNGYARNDWVLNYLFRATSGGLNTVAGLRPVQGVPGLENVDVTDKVAGHMSYRAFMPLILDSLGFPVTSDYFDEPEEPDFEEERIVVREEEAPKKRRWFGSKGKKSKPPIGTASRPPSASSFPSFRRKSSVVQEEPAEDELPPREEKPVNVAIAAPGPADARVEESSGDIGEVTPKTAEASHLPPAHAGFDIHAIKAAIGKEDSNEGAIKLPQQDMYAIPYMRRDMERSESAPPPLQDVVPSSPSSLGRSSRPTAVGTTSQTDLPSMLSKSMFVDEDEEVTSSLGHELEDSSRRNLPGPRLTFGAPWSAQAEQPVPDQLYGGGFVNPFSDPTDDAPASSPGTSYLPGRTNVSSDPFRVAGKASSFGGSDGTITINTGGSHGDLDPWSNTLGSQKPRADSFAANPWS
ncbi:DUF726-domain-containing protein [Punctularia strigosozonata HHB-11173 SS5]|uniref:DUF726-domain-containing protein n=1 Tax=Punctularia strigosozonata (strain HHB-11173) TaxID=741275 RepID=UPI00044185FC|nr:DUF726-domain-containing protein [Punctularia strigosozonata HHB-11173 SS5]EIN14328.1 DUF726-domain-containing protein [Punctularia strigosozonata HHB-11173 SS5]